MAAFVGTDTGPVTVSVAPTETLLAAVDHRFGRRAIVQVENLDVSQVLNARVKRRLDVGNGFTVQPTLDLDSISPGGSADRELELESGNVEYQVTGSASGAGLNARVTVRKVG